MTIEVELNRNPDLEYGEALLYSLPRGSILRVIESALSPQPKGKFKLRIKLELAMVPVSEE